ncbi:uncharacterized protein LOC143298823 [Babylonia areolata]|uniref:uncharacterized protein LOC143298823 n=1 Tax=Babylonia areolata TaxID=304850 RepID=UPI003FD0F8A4
MASNSDDFDDFFDTSKPTAHNLKKTDQSRKTVSVSSDHELSTDYSSDSSDQNQNRRRTNRRSRSSSPRSRDRSLSDDSRSRSPRWKGNRDRDSYRRSRSSGTESGGSRTASSDSVTPEKEDMTMKAKVIKHRGSNLSADASDTVEKKHAQPKPANSVGNQAWTAETMSQKHKPAKGDNSNSSSSDHRKSRQGHRKKKHSPDQSDSDITDVSPMSSPRNSQGESRNKHDAKPPKYLIRAPGVKMDSRKATQGEDKKSMDLNLLMKAVSELEKQTRVQSNTHRVMFDSGRSRREQKSNYTFSDSDTHRIDQENQRLLRQLMCRMHSVDGRYTGSAGRGKKSVAAASGINRMRDHHRIEKENLAFLKRLQQIQPSRGISRQEQLSVYNTTLLHGVPISTMHAPVPAGPVPDRRHQKSRSSSTAATLSRTRSLASLQSAASTTTTTSSQRGHSGRLRSRPASAKSSSVRDRPPWDDRW